jgi:hypothetical protein
VSELVIRAMSIDADSISIEYMELPTDVRHNGLVMQQHTVVIAKHPEYQDEFEALEEAALDLLRDALEDYANTEPVQLRPAVDVDDDRD